MRIKRLELLGFKSFPNKTNLEFQTGITGVVGPNGCGKSNIVDAIRWVMGEMSAKHLRGKQMEDVIFSGSDVRNPTNYAEVSLILSLEDGGAPAAYLNFSEIAVTRRLHRSGESEYFINQNPCRLKDIYDVFLGSGVGTKAYSIIEQGKIGSIVTAKPEERRYIIEEAAGISKFKNRKEAAERKIESTKTNLTRLADVLAELKRQLNSLDRQARKAERYRELRDKAKTIEMHLSSLQYLATFQQLQAQEQSLIVSKENEVLQSAELEQVELNYEQNRVELLELENELMKLQEQLFSQNNQLRLAETNIEYKNKEILQQQQQSDQAGKELTENNLQLIELAESLQNATLHKETLDAQHQEFSNNLQNMSSHLQTVELREQELKNQLDLLQSELLQLSQTIIQDTSRREATLHREVELKDRIASRKLELDQLDQQLQNCRKQGQHFETELSQLKQFKLDLGTLSSDVEANIAKLKTELLEKENELDLFKQEYSQKQSRFVSLQEMQQRFEGYDLGVRTILQNREQLQSQAEISGTVADIFECETQYEIALSAVLGERIQYIVVDSHQAGIHALQYLQNQAQGRCAFVPSKLRNVKHASVSLMAEGVLACLQDVVRVDAHHANIADYLLSDVYVVDTLNNALKIWQDQDPQVTLVTLNGEVIDPSGMVMGGDHSGVHQDLFEKKRESKELQQTLQVMHSQMQVKEEIIHKIEQRLQSLQEQMKQMQQDTHQEEIKIIHQEKDLHHLQNQVRQLAERREQMSMEIAKWLEEQQQLTNQYEELNQYLTQAMLQKSELETRTQTTTTQWEESKLQLQTGRAQFNDQRVLFAGIEEKRSSIHKEFQRMQDMQQRATQQVQDKKQLIDQSAQLVMQLTQEIGELRVQTGQHLAQVQLLEQSQQSIKQRYELAKMVLQEQELQLKQLRQEVQLLRNQLNDLLIAITQARSELQMLTGRIFERYHVELAAEAGTYKDQPIDVEQKSVELAEYREKLDKMGEVNVGAIEEYDSIKTRHDFLQTQYDDLNQSIDSLQRAIHKINRTTRKRFQETFDAVNQKFQELYPKMFKGGRAELRLTGEEDILTAGVEIVAQPPGKKLQNISLLSGGEKALTAISLVFAIFLIKPSPFCLLDEVDAPLDDANIDRFNEMVKTMVSRTQFIVITHNKRTMEIADTLYGITMEQPGVSKLVSVELNKASEKVNVA